MERAAQETEYDRQIQIVDLMIARGVDGIAVAAAERTPSKRIDLSARVINKADLNDPSVQQLLQT